VATNEIGRIMNTKLIKRFLIGALLIFLAVFAGLFLWLRSIADRPDVRNMATMGFGDDLMAFYAKNQRLPQDWEEYSKWYSRTQPKGRRNAQWARKRFDLVCWGKPVPAPTDTNYCRIVVIIDPTLSDFETPFNLWLRGVLSGADKRCK
jgi:hypothetical protein